MSTFNRLHLIRQVDLLTLKLFLSAVEEQQIGLAAIRENVAASTATKRIQELEDVAGIKLLERGPKGSCRVPRAQSSSAIFAGSSTISTTCARRSRRSPTACAAS